MDMIFCKGSSQVVAYGFDPEKKCLEIQFKGGGTYRYSGVPLSAFDGLKASESVGSYLNQNIKGKYPFERLGLGGLGQIETDHRK